MVTNSGEVLGDYSDATGFVHGYRWSFAEGFATLDVPGKQTSVREENERGDISGLYVDATGVLHGFLIRDGTLETVDYPGGANGGGTLVINNRDVIVGGFIDADAKEHGFIAR
jgi:hypothetical protein